MIRIGSGALWLLVILCVQQVIARYFFRQSLIWVQELQLFCFSILWLLAIGNAFKNKIHVCVDVFSAQLRPQSRRSIHIAGFFIALLPTSLLIIYTGFFYTLRARNFMPADFETLSHWFSSQKSFAYALNLWFVAGERSANPGGLAGFWIWKALIPLAGIGLLTAGVTDLITTLKAPYDQGRGDS